MFCFGVAAVAWAAEANVAPPSPQATMVVRADPRTGKLVQTVVLKGKKPVRDQRIEAIVEKAAQTHSVDPLLVHSMIKVESNYNPYAVSNKGAQGLMQLMPPTARDLGVKNSFDPEQNITAGVRYLKYLQELYKDDRLALAAYNAGPGAVKKFGWVPPYAETQNYVQQVGKKYSEARREAEKTRPSPEPAVTEIVKRAEEPRKVEQFIDANGRLHLRTR
jgi:soluble lytic murein transglycosylase-like protein